MKWAYVDSSLIIATLFQDGPARSIKKLWLSADRFVSSYLLEVEVLSAATRERFALELVEPELRKIGYVRTHSLATESKVILGKGYLRGADLYHVATALWIQNKHTGLKFLSLDEKQLVVARKVGLS